jgi:hypothetical protein
MADQDELHNMEANQQLAAMGLGPEQEDVPAASQQGPAMEPAAGQGGMAAAEEQAHIPEGAAEMNLQQDDLHTLSSEQQLAAMGLSVQEEQTPGEALEPEQIAAMEASRQQDESP